MKRNERILIALSFTPTDEDLIRYARLLRELGFGRHFDFVHVRAENCSGVDARTDAEIRQAIEGRVTELFASERGPVSYACHVLTGARVDALVEFVLKNRSDLALLGHRQNRSGQRSLARRLAMIAPCSVWMLPEGAPISISQILAPVDFSEHSADSLQVAASIARAANLTDCLAAHVFFDPSSIRYDEHVDEMRRTEQESFRQLVAGLDLGNINVEPIFVEGNNVARTLLHTAERHACDLIVMNTRGRSRAAAILLGSVTTQVMIESRVAVLAVKHYGAMLDLFEALKQSQFWMRSNPKTN